MDRKSKVTQEAVDTACQQQLKDGKNVTVKAIIDITGGSFSTVGVMVKQWRKVQEEKDNPVIEMPEGVSQAMKKATFSIWKATSTLANEKITQIQKKTDITVNHAKAELSEYVNEVSRIENELEQANQTRSETEKSLIDLQKECADLKTQNAVLESRLKDQENQLERLRTDYHHLQSELISIAKKGKPDIKKDDVKQ